MSHERRIRGCRRGRFDALGAVAELFGEPFTVGLALGGGGAAVAFVVASNVYNAAETNRRVYRMAMGRLILEIATDVERNDQLNGNTLAAIATAASADAHGDEDSARDTLAAIIRTRREHAEAGARIAAIEAQISEREGE